MLSAGDGTAREQNAKSLELRVAISMGRLRIRARQVS